MSKDETISAEEIEKTGVEFPKDLLKLVRKRVIDRGIKMKDAVREAFSLWLVTNPVEFGSPYVDPVVALRDQIGQLAAADERLHRIIQARVVEVANQQEQEMLTRVVHLLHVTGFQKRLRDLLKDVERERGKRIMVQERKEESG